MKVRIIAILLILLPALCFADAQADLNKLLNTISSQERELQKLESSQAGLAQQISLIQKNQADIKRAISVTNTQIANNQNSINKLQRELRELENTSEQYRKQAQQAMIFTLDNAGTLSARAILAGNDSSQTATNLELLSEVNFKLMEQIEAYQTAVLEIQDKQSQLDSANTELEIIQKDNQRLMANFQNSNKQLQDKLALVRKDTKAQQDYLEKLYNEEERLNKLIDELKTAKVPSSSAFGKSQGKLPRPLVGRVIEDYGRKLIPEAGIEVMNKGIKIRPSSGGDVKTIFDGTVVFVDNIFGLGNIVIVQHDSEFFTVYSNLDDYFVENSDEIKQNDVLGRINVDLKSDSSYLYFEIRRHDVALNPNQWLMK